MFMNYVDTLRAWEARCAGRLAKATGKKKRGQAAL
jgi:hypothetical protein